ncbi:MAG: VWA domain-containing protein [Chloroflexi bacterium]|nr:VWA domain-containing protein [Chloroflexota bacterium]
MSVLNPIALLFALLAIPIILLYLLRLQRREQTVSSTLLWQQVVLDREANTLWQRLRRNLLLVLQLLTLAFLVFALIRPYLNMPATLSGQLIVLLDGSASMQATDVSPSRFEAAKVQVRRLIDELGPNNEMTIVLVDGSPHALTGSTNSKSELNAALDAALPSLTPANWSAAIALAAATGGGDANTSATTVVVSDGANADDLRLITGNARYIPIGSSGENVAISTLSLRRTTRGMAAFVRVTNTGSSAERVLASLRADGVLLDARTLDVPAGQSTGWTVNGFDPQLTAVHATIDRATNNKLPLDDVAYAVNTNNATRRALLLTRGNRFLEQALSVLPNLQVTRAITPPVAGDLKPYDLYVLDGISMTLPPRANVMFIGAQSVFTTSGIFSNTAFVRAEPHPVLQSANFRNVNAVDVSRVNVPSWLKPVVESQGGPLLFAGEQTGENARFGRVVLIPFELRRSDLPLQIAFPILIVNSVEWLSPPQGLSIPTNVKPGEVVPLPQGTIVQLPSGNRVAVDQRGFALTNEVGVYRVQVNDTTSAFAVNFAHAAESQITPNPQLAVGGSAPVSEVKPQFSQREVWSWLALLALVLLVIEWWIYQRGVPVLQRQRRSS